MARRHRSPQRFWGIVGAVCALIIAAALVLVVDVDPYLAWLGGASVTLFGLYGFDKRRAGGSGRRVPEVVLHVLALAGGVAGGWAGRFLFRHKTRSMTFLLVLVVATLVHAALVFWLLM